MIYISQKPLVSTGMGSLLISRIYMLDGHLMSFQRISKAKFSGDGMAFECEFNVTESCDNIFKAMLTSKKLLIRSMITRSLSKFSMKKY